MCYNNLIDKSEVEERNTAMKEITKVSIGIAFVVAIVVSFIAGSYIKEQEYIDSRMQYCNTFISFAIDKAESKDLSNKEIREALISNVYAAYEFCDKPNLSEQLHNLWNTLIVDAYIGREDTLVTQLRDISNMMQIQD